MITEQQAIRSFLLHSFLEVVQNVAAPFTSYCKFDNHDELKTMFISGTGMF
jgi:hypothetical protein